MQEIFFIALFVLLLGAPGIIWLVVRPQTLSARGRYWMAPIVISILLVMAGGGMLNQLMGWSEFWGFFSVWVIACTLAWWVPTYDRNRRGRIAAAARIESGAQTEAKPGSES